MGKQIAELPQADREKFFKDAKELSTKEIKERLQMQLTKEETYEESWMLVGSFVPLSVWATEEGCDPEQIREKSLPICLVR